MMECASTHHLLIRQNPLPAWPMVTLFASGWSGDILQAAARRRRGGKTAEVGEIMRFPKEGPIGV